LSKGYPVSSVLETLTQALQHHQTGRRQQAEAMYRQVLARDPRNADALHLLGMLAYEAGQHETATACIAEAIHINPWIAPFHNNLGTVLEARGELEDALLCFQQALRLDPAHAEAHVNLGNVLGRVGRSEEAVAHYRQAIQLRPSCAEAHNNLGNALRTRGEFEEALVCFRQALALKPEYAEAWLNLANVLRDQERFQEAERCCREALRRKPELAEGYSNLGAILLRQERIQEAEECCRQALLRKPGLADALSNVGAILLLQQRPEEAEVSCRQALEGNPQHPEAWNNLGNVLLEKGRIQEAIACYQEARRIKPDHADAHYNLGNALSVQQRFEQAAVSYRQAIEIKPDSANAHWNLALALLHLGDFEQGWREYEWRWKRKQTPPRSFEQPPWDGSPLAGRTILLYGEQGLGDTIQFIRYAPLVKQLGGNVLVECQASLVGLLEGVEGVNRFLPAGAPLPQFDLHAALLSLPRLLGTTLETIPAPAHYLRVAPGLVERWRQRIGADSRFKVALVWAGNSTHPNDQNRSFTPDQFAPLERTPGVVFFSLQRGPQAEQLALAPAGLGITPLEEESNQPTDTAAIMLNLDLVITVDTLTAHLAGALGRPVWTLLSFVADWRWLVGREDSPWYPTMRLFRQPRLGDWRAVMERVREALDDARSR
jgi:tetratricopeptide (TPR) repeat protein